MKFSEKVNLNSFNTFGLDAYASYFVNVSSEEEIQRLLLTAIYKNNPSLILGGGSNVLFRSDFEGLVIKNNLMGRSLVKQDDDFVWIKLGAGENWHNTVLYAIAKGWGGIENMSLIPGTVGAAPMQNIGAYGVEIKDVFDRLDAINLSTGKVETFKKDHCDFGYRSSVFKQELKGKYLITAVTLRLHKRPTINIAYGAIQDTLQEMGIVDPGIREVSDAVIAIRSSKLPDPSIIGNAGSFFKNPTITTEEFARLRQKFPGIKGYEQEVGIKVPAGWLIEEAGWKGKTFGHVGVHKYQALVLVNYGGGKGDELYELSENIKQSVFSKFGIGLEREVNVV